MSVDFKILQTSFNAVKEELENIDVFLDYNYDDFTDNQKQVLNEMYASVLNVIKIINFTLNADDIFISKK